MKQQLLKSEIIRFIGKVILFTIICLVFYGIGSIGIWLVNNIEDGDCILNWDAWGYCVIDSVILTLLATIGATAAYNLLMASLREIGSFILIIGKIISSSNEELQQFISETDNQDSSIKSISDENRNMTNQPLTKINDDLSERVTQGEFGTFICDWTEKEIKGKKVSFKNYLSEDSGYNKFDILGHICPFCNKVSDKNFKESGIKFNWWSGFDNSICKSCGNIVKEPFLILKSKQ